MTTLRVRIRVVWPREMTSGIDITRRKEHRQSSEAADRRGEVEIQLEEPGMLGGENKQTLKPAPGKGSWADPGGFCEFWSKP